MKAKEILLKEVRDLLPTLGPELAPKAMFETPVLGSDLLTGIVAQLDGLGDQACTLMAIHTKSSNVRKSTRATSSFPIMKSLHKLSITLEKESNPMLKKIISMKLKPENHKYLTWGYKHIVLQTQKFSPPPKPMDQMVILTLTKEKFLSKTTPFPRIFMPKSGA